MRFRPFLVGLAAGALVAAVPAWLMRPASRPSLLGATRGGADAGDDSAADASLTAEVQRLREQVARLENSSTRREVQPDDADASGAPAATAAPVEASAAVPTADLPALLAELELQLTSGALAERYANDPVGLRSTLVQNWLAVGEPGQALGLLRGLEPPHDTLAYARSIGDALKKSGDPALAAEAFLISLRANPEDWGVVQRLMEASPDAALAQLSATSSGDELSNDARAQRALLLLASGDREAGLAAFDALAEAGEAPSTAYYHLARRDPIAAEARLRTYLEANPENSQYYELLLADSLSRQGRREDAVEHVESMLARSPHDQDAIRKLGQVDRNQAIRYLEQRLAVQPTADMFGAYGSQLTGAGRQEDALDAYWRAWELSPNGGWANRLLSMAPERAATRLTQAAAARNDDELFGDIADALWRAGQHDRARILWERAHEIDRSDSEWTGKLGKVARGADPMR